MCDEQGKNVGSHWELTFVFSLLKVSKKMPSPVNRLTDPNTDPIDVLSVVNHTLKKNE
jgi:hypothetical protein